MLGLPAPCLPLACAANDNVLALLRRIDELFTGTLGEMAVDMTLRLDNARALPTCPPPPQQQQAA
jgi:hypothetical protein